MKFTRDEAIKELVAKYTSKVEKIEDWKRTIEESVDHAIKLIGDSSEIELANFVDLTIPFLDTANGFLRKKNADLAKDLNGQITSLKTQIEDLKKGKNTQTNTTGDEQNEEMKKLLERIDALEKENKQSKTEKTVSEKKAEIKSKLKEKGVKRDDWIDLILSEANIDENTDVETKATSYLAMYNKMYANVEFTDTIQEPGEEPDVASKKLIETIQDAAQIAKQRIV